MDRITDKNLDGLAATLNRITDSPMTAYTRGEDGKSRANIGHYHISHAYGGVCLHRMCNEGGGVTTPLSSGHVRKRALYDAMHAYLAGLLEAR